MSTHPKLVKQKTVIVNIRKVCKKLIVFIVDSLGKKSGKWWGKGTTILSRRTFKSH